MKRWKPGHPLAIKPFCIGQRVEFTTEAREHFAFAPEITHQGTVVGQSRDKRYILVLQDGRRQRCGFHPAFWKPVRRRAPQRGER